MLIKTGKGKDLQLPLLQAAEAKKFDISAMVEKAKNSPEVFTLFELIKFYAKESARRARERLIKLCE